MVTNFFSKMKTAITFTKENLVNRIEDLVLGEKEIDENVLDDLEAILIGADIGVQTTMEILDNVRKEISRDRVNDYDALITLIKKILRETMESAPTTAVSECNVSPRVIFVVGVKNNHHRQIGLSASPGRTTSCGLCIRYFPCSGH